MKFEVDQSGRIEETNRDTVIALANSEAKFSAKISRKAKRNIQFKFKKIKRPKMFAIYGFTASLILLIKASKIKRATIIIDIEYPGYEKMIKKILEKELDNKFDIRFKSIGKSSNAHQVAYFTYKKKWKEDLTINQNELETLMFKFVGLLK